MSGACEPENGCSTRPPQQWIPSETKQAGPKGDIGDFQARVDGIYAQFLKTVEAGRGAQMSADKARATEARHRSDT